jgi:hypothetical protein
MVVTVDGLVPLYPLQKQSTVSLQLQVPSGRTLDRIMFTINVLMTDGPVLNAKNKNEQPSLHMVRPHSGIGGNGGGGGDSSGAAGTARPGHKNKNL